MRAAWQDHIRKTRKKMISQAKKEKKDTNISHRQAMTKASESWGDLKKKLEKRMERARKKELKKSSKGKTNEVAA